VKLQSDAENIILTISDDGQGFDPASEMETTGKPSGIGLAGMYERLEAIGGKLEIETAPGQGTKLIASVPLIEEVPST
jgi:signal transduction histidine kinase